MAFTYRGDLSTDRDKVRFHIRDVAEESGPLPDDGNFSDEELDGLIALSDDWAVAVAEAFRALSTAWANYADISAGPRKESLSQISERYSKLADEWGGRSLEVGYMIMDFAEHDDE